MATNRHRDLSSDMMVELDCGAVLTAEVEYSPAEAMTLTYPGCDECAGAEIPGFDWMDLILVEFWADACPASLERLELEARKLCERVQEQALQYIHDQQQSYAEGLADAQYEAMKDRRMGL